MKRYLDFWSYLSDFFLELEIFQANFVEKIKERILWSITFFFRKSYRLWYDMENMVEQDRSQMII